MKDILKEIIGKKIQLGEMAPFTVTWVDEYRLHNKIFLCDDNDNRAPLTREELSTLLHENVVKIPILGTNCYSIKLILD